MPDEVLRVAGAQIENVVGDIAVPSASSPAMPITHAWRPFAADEPDLGDAAAPARSYAAIPDETGAG